MNTFKRIRKLAVELFEVDESEVVPEASLVDDLGLDALEDTELIMAVEEEFGIEIPDEEAQKMETAQHLIEYIERCTEVA